MTIEEAIKLLEELRVDAIEQLDPHYQNAAQLGIEALKYLAHLREVGREGIAPLIPGETKE